MLQLQTNRCSFTTKTKIAFKSKTKMMTRSVILFAQPLSYSPLLSSLVSQTKSSTWRSNRKFFLLERTSFSESLMTLKRSTITLMRSLIVWKLPILFVLRRALMIRPSLCTILRVDRFSGRSRSITRRGLDTSGTRLSMELIWCHWARRHMLMCGRLSHWCPKYIWASLLENQLLLMDNFLTKHHIL